MDLICEGKQGLRRSTFGRRVRRSTTTTPPYKRVVVERLERPTAPPRPTAVFEVVQHQSSALRPTSIIGRSRRLASFPMTRTRAPVLSHVATRVLTF